MTYLNLDCMDPERGLPSLPEGSIKLLIVDPPYFEVKGDFDFIWPDFDSYLADVDRWAHECKRVLAPNGSLFWWGHARKIAYTQVILDKYFTLENSCVWKKEDAQTRKNSPATMRTFPPITERCLFYSHGTEPNEWQQTGWESVKLNTANFGPLREYFKEFQEQLGTTKKAIIEAVGQRADHCFRWGSTQWDLPTPETYADLLKLTLLNGWEPRPYESLRLEYESLRLEYEALRRPFNNEKHRLFDVWEFSQEAHITKNYDHDTKKPPKLTRALIETCSNPGDLVCAPFGGSGTEGEQAILTGREFTGFEIDPKHWETCCKRLEAAKVEKARIDSQLTIFTPDQLRPEPQQTTLFE